MNLDHLIGVCPTWGLHTAHPGGAIAGPLATLAGQSSDVTITVIPGSAVPRGTAGETVHVRENAQEFDVTYHEFGGYHGLWHGRGRNWILWSGELKHVYIAQGDEPWPRTWTYVKYVLRHFIVASLLARPGYRALHAVAGALPEPNGQAGVMIVGPWLSGKTTLLQGLIERGIVSELVEDDCAVMDANWRLACLIPAENECRQIRHLDIRGLICLDNRTDRVHQTPASQAATWAVRQKPCWPLTWIPGAETPETSLDQALPTALRCLRAPQKPAVGDVVACMREMGLAT